MKQATEVARSSEPATSNSLNSSKLFFSELRARQGPNRSGTVRRPIAKVREYEGDLHAECPSPTDMLAEESAKGSSACRSKTEEYIQVGLISTSSLKRCLTDRQKVFVDDKGLQHTRSLIMIDPMTITPPAPRPQNARATMKCSTFGAKEHQIVAMAKMNNAIRFGCLRPM